MIESIYPDMAKISPNPEIIENCVYDFGGFVTSGVLPILKASSAVLVPTSNDYNSILRTVETIEELQPLNENLFIVVTKTEKEGDFETVKNAINQHFDNLKFFELRLSKAFKNCIETGLSLTELYHETPLSKSAYKTVYQQYQSILELFKGE